MESKVRDKKMKSDSSPEQMKPEEFWKKWMPKQKDIVHWSERETALKFAEAYYQYRASLGEPGQELRDVKRDRQRLLANLCEVHGEINLCSVGPCGMCRADIAERELAKLDVRSLKEVMGDCAVHLERDISTPNPEDRRLARMIRRELNAMSKL